MENRLLALSGFDYIYYFHTNGMSVGDDTGDVF